MEDDLGSLNPPLLRYGWLYCGEEARGLVSGVKWTVFVRGMRPRDSDASDEDADDGLAGTDDDGLGGSGGLFAIMAKFGNVKAAW